MSEDLNYYELSLVEKFMVKLKRIPTDHILERLTTISQIDMDETYYIETLGYITPKIAKELLKKLEDG